MVKQKINSYKRRKKNGFRKVVTVSAYERKVKPKKKVYIEVEDEEDEKIEIGLIMCCNNTEKMSLKNNIVIIDCPTCDFECGFPKKKQRKMTLELLKEITEG